MSIQKVEYDDYNNSATLALALRGGPTKPGIPESDLGHPEPAEHLTDFRFKGLASNARRGREVA